MAGRLIRLFVEHRSVEIKLGEVRWIGSFIA